MAAPHNLNRYGEVWRIDRINAMIDILLPIRDEIILSGGWAWHFISPPHVEYKHLHDHKDADIFVEPVMVQYVANYLINSGFKKTSTRYDTNTFRRYSKEPKIIIDLFIGFDMPFININGWNIIEPKFLLSLYKEKLHQSNACIAVVEATKLLSKGINPINREELIVLPIKHG